ncbi:MAG: hypothetical protein A9183_02995 [Dehalococcoides mccartyi]|uniref:hypothetical protein n=1 Tax=Dehalococcoides mccartyi TaxID=61435 RepID=UPI0008047AF3|nr:hypothetical protein [Dehalococcoides mccartyi]OBW61085.1 MAG: hypothetical protein A9183_02995 [Dehalococcoides mccartyi]
MILQYTDVMGDGQPHQIKAEITTDHPASHYGIPVVLLPDGYALNAESWVLMSYRVLRITPTERPLMESWLSNLYAMLGIPTMSAQMGRKGGQSKSDAKTQAARENGKKGGRPKKQEE